MSSYSSKKEKSKKKYFPYLILIMVSFIFLLIISYFIYYNTILASEEIVKNNLFKIKEKYSVITDNLLMDKLFLNDINGSISIDNTYVYNFMKEEKKYYINTPTLNVNTYVSNDVTKDLNMNIDFDNINEYDYIKKFYFYENRPIVEVSFSLNKEELERIFKKTLKGNYDVNIILRNNAFSNEILNIEIVINNKNNNDVKTIVFSNNNILVNTINNNYEFKINVDDDIFNVKIYKNKELYSVLSGTPTLNTYKYTYQKINKLYTLNLISSKKDDNYNYELSSNINNVSSSLVLVISNMSLETTSLMDIIDNNTLIEADKTNYDNDIKFLKDFINKY